MLGHVRGHVGWVRNLIHRGRIVATKRVYVHSGQESENTERGTLQGVRDNVRGRAEDAARVTPMGWLLIFTVCSQKEAVGSLTSMSVKMFDIGTCLAALD